MLSFGARVQYSLVISCSFTLNLPTNLVVSWLHAGTENCAELWPSMTRVENYYIIWPALLWFPQSNIVHPFSLSYHPFAMLSSFKAVDHSRKHSKYCMLHCTLPVLGHWYVCITEKCFLLPAERLKRWNTLHNKGALAELEKLKGSSPSPSSLSSFSVSPKDSASKWTTLDSLSIYCICLYLYISISLYYIFVWLSVLTQFINKLFIMNYISW